MKQKLSFQQEFSPNGTCFGCGPKNAAGLLIDSFQTGDGEVVCDWTPGPEHTNGGSAVCGGVLSSILDCHGVAAASYALTQRDGERRVAVTKEFTVQFLRPTPLETVRFVATVTELRARSAAIAATASVNGDVCVRFQGLFVVPRAIPST